MGNDHNDVCLISVIATASVRMNNNNKNSYVMVPCTNGILSGRISAWATHLKKTILPFMYYKRAWRYVIMDVFRGGVGGRRRSRRRRGAYDDFVNFKMICWLSLSEVLIRIECACVRS